MVHRCARRRTRFAGDVELLDLRTIAPWDREAVLDVGAEDGPLPDRARGHAARRASAPRSPRRVAQEAFWYLDAPVERLAVEDVPMPYHPVLLDAVLPTVSSAIATRSSGVLRV